LRRVGTLPFRSRRPLRSRAVECSERRAGDQRIGEGEELRGDVALQEVLSEKFRITAVGWAIAASARQSNLDDGAWCNDLLSLWILGTDTVDENLTEGARLAAEEASGRMTRAIT